MKNNKKLKATQYVNEDTKEIRSLIFIILGILVVLVGLYYLTTYSLNKNKETTTDVEFDYSVATVGTMFNRPYDEYYVFLYKSNSDEAVQYSALVTNYSTKEDALKVYTVDLSKNLDDQYLSETSNHNPTNPSEVKIKDSALILIKNGKVSKYYETIGEYEKVFN